MKAEHGFTLLELLISVALLGLLMVVLFDGLEFATRHLKAEDAGLDRAARLALVENLLRAQLAGAQPVAASAADEGVVDFDGQSNGVAFISEAPEAVRSGGLQVLSIDFAAPRGSPSGALLARWRRYRGAPEGRTSDHRTVLLDHVARVAFAYYGSAGPDDAPAWHSRWQDMAFLPLLVRLSVAFADGDKAPDLIVALRLAASPAEQWRRQHEHRL